MRKSVPDQFHTLFERTGLSLDVLAKRMGYKRASSIQRYLSADDFRGEYLKPEIVAKVSEAILGLGNPPITEQEILALGGPFLVRPKERTIPVISYVQAGQWTTTTEAYAEGNGYDEIRADKFIGENSFALDIKGTSMLPRFLEGDRIIIDPDIEPIPGDFVVAKEDRDGGAVFKQYRPRGFDARRRPIIELTPLNEAWPTIILDVRNPGRIIGTMVEHHSYRKP